jgi:hypothetical protein
MLKKTLRDTGRKYRKKVFGRIIEYRHGFFVKTIIIYNYSDSTFKICSSKEIIDKLLRNKIIYAPSIYFETEQHVTSKPSLTDNLHVEIYKLLMKRQETINYRNACRIEKYLISVFTILIFTILTILLRNIYVSIESLIIFLVIMILLPRIHVISGKNRLFPVIKCFTLSKKLRRIDEEIISRIKYLPENDPLRKIALTQLNMEYEKGGRG